MRDDVVLLNDTGQPIGAVPKSTVHSRSTPLHLAFSCHVADAAGSVLVTRRSLAKATWPGVWTNSFCGHPRPGEPVERALIRHAAHELGMHIAAITPVIPDFRYAAVDANGIMENEVCPIYTAIAGGPVRPDPAEVMDYAWVDPSDLEAALKCAPWAFIPWFTLQAEQLDFSTLTGRPQ
ncbi:isopentenyl-diphosphate Delta-isomerase [Glycomyces sp. YM15]|uniref:isopentenyl-diphosphate Delta-isomerase n=1 Tax=Glycomyces sp. YM15 TaxID=2800446 RepID=UPI001F06ABE8|nr:isopentenyl-diphosphate Delta-isomerase [Glycomyces sp. YM15]